MVGIRMGYISIYCDRLAMLTSKIDDHNYQYRFPMNMQIPPPHSALHPHSNVTSASFPSIPSFTNKRSHSHHHNNHHSHRNNHHSSHHHNNNPSKKQRIIREISTCENCKNSGLVK